MAIFSHHGVTVPARDERPWSTVITSLIGRAATVGAVAALALTGYGAARLDKVIDLSVDGQVTSMHVFGSTVADALAKTGLTIGAHDLVAPAPDQAIEDGTAIIVRYGRQLTVTVDGVTSDYWTTATTVDQAMNELGIRALSGATLSVSRSAGVGREGLRLVVTNPRQVTLKVDGAERAESTSAASVAELLSALGVSLGQHDRVSPAKETAITEGLAIAVARVELRTTTATEKLAFKTVKKDDATMTKGQTKVTTQGSNGEQVVTYTETWVDGTLEDRAATGTTVTKPATDKVVLVGTKAAPVISAGNTSGAGLNLANAAMWDRIAKCESGGRWNINTGNGYYGGLQFNYATWLSVGGADFASRADLASREEQITVANRLYAQRGLQPWGCRWAA